VNDPSPFGSITDLREFLTQTAPTVPVWQFVPGLVAAGVLCWLLGVFYRRFGHSLSNRDAFSRNFPAIGMTTMLIITIVKSSLALSLGLVGALSIIRFRTAIKEPEELAYLFLTIGVGLGFGADQWLITSTAFALILLVLRIRAGWVPREEPSNLYITVRGRTADGASLAGITHVLREHTSALDLKRFDEADGALEVSYRASFPGFEELDRAKQALRAQDGSLSVSFVDSDGLL
jgi:hypothetical protein